MHEHTLLLQNTDGIQLLGIKAGAALIKPAQDYDYGYRHSEIKDPFGYAWLIKRKYPKNFRSLVFIPSQYGAYRPIAVPFSGNIFDWLSV